MRAEDRPTLLSLLERIGEFGSSEQSVATELIDGALTAEYECLVAERDGATVGYLCWGRTPMTDHTVDLYWMAVDPSTRRGGVGLALVRAFEEEARRGGAKVVRIETETSPPYAGAVGLYERAGYTLSGRIANFYHDSVDLLMFSRQL